MIRIIETKPVMSSHRPNNTLQSNEGLEGSLILYIYSEASCPPSYFKAICTGSFNYYYHWELLSVDVLVCPASDVVVCLYGPVCCSAEEEKYMREAYNMKDEVKGLINGVMDPLAKLELIDAVQRLGLKYHFEGEIKQSLDDLIHLHNDAWCSDDLHATALRFRLLRQHGCDVPKGTCARFTPQLFIWV
ncbi:hypothetical protein TEA_023465 [Camellia sinensis var. sinensis]|uniref:Terpene synthase N-terminal domain-containing protein n=1 Tax=Camellia sinensis var. sinensis TaxID=542762 RepID=A0A4S4EZR2_CAMSN|nr:hypothetical protein TEA_023465 [Camellia sinensis var. sinensis]